MGTTFGGDTPRDHVIVCGLHSEGMRVIEQLRLAGVEAVVVDHQPDVGLVVQLHDLAVPYVRGDAREAATLIEAGLHEAKAIICAESDDLQTLATALLARSLRPEIRVVAQLRNAAVGAALGEIGVHVLDVAALAAPAVTDVCLDTGAQELVLAGQSLMVVQVVCERDATLRELYGDLAPIGVISASSGAEVVVAPGRDHAVRGGDTAVVIGTAGDVAARGLRIATGEPAQTTTGGARSLHSERHHRPGLLPTVLSILDRRVRLALGALALLTVTSVVMLKVGYREPDGTTMSLIDAIYFTVETIATVGFGDFSFREQSAWLRVWAICLMVVGALTATIFFALLTNLLIGRTITQALGRRNLTAFVDHTIVIGAGAVGMGVVDRLQRSGQQVVVVDRDDDNARLRQITGDSVAAVVGDATEAETLSEARLSEARAVAVMTSDDLVNLETGLAVRAYLGDRWPAVPVVLRLFDRGLSSTVGESFDFRHVRSPAALAAPWFVGAAIGLDVQRTFYVGDRPMLVVRFEADGDIVGRAMVDIAAQVRIVLIRRSDGSVEVLPRRHTRLAAGDNTWVVGPHAEILSLVRDYALH